LPGCYRNAPTQAHPARSLLLRFLVFLIRYILLGLLSLVNQASLNQRAVGSTPTRPTIFRGLTNHLPILLPGGNRVASPLLPAVYVNVPLHSRLPVASPSSLNWLLSNHRMCH